MVALAVLLIVGGAALAGLLALRLDSREPVVVLNQDVAAGTEITVDMLNSTGVASEGLLLVPEDEVEEVLGTFTTVPIAQGQLLETPMLTSASPLSGDLAEVGVPITAGRVPSDLRSGDVVRLVRLSDGGGDVSPIATAFVKQLGSTEAGGTLSGGGEAGTQLTLLVPAQAADAAVDAAANETIGMSLVERGVDLTDAQLQVLQGAPE